MNYIEPDTRWELWGVTTIEEHIEKNVIKGIFHKAVPKDVQKAYETAEYMMVYSFCHWQMFDEAVKKIAVIAEMAIKQKALQLNIKLKVINKNGVSVDQKLNSLIDQVLKGKGSEDLREAFHQIKRFRNAFIHQEQNSFAGGSLKSHIRPMLNRINELFYEGELHANDHELIIEQLKLFQKKCLILEVAQKKHLVFLPQLNDSIAEKNFYSFSYEILYDKLEKDKLPTDTHIIALSELRVSNEEINGSIVTGEKFRIYPTDKEENIKRYKNALSHINNSEEIKMTYYAVKNHRSSTEVEKFRYNNAWT